MTEGQKYFIGWTATTGKTGQGTKSFPKKDAQEDCDKLNERHARINLRHYLIKDEATDEIST